MAAFIGSLFVVNHFSGETALRPFTEVNSNSYVEISNHTTLTRFVYASAKAVDSTHRYLGFVNPCHHERFKLPYVDTQVTVDVNGALYTFSVNKPKTYPIEIYSTDGHGCPEFSKTASRIILYVDPASWKESGYWRLGEVLTPVKVIFAGDGTVCAVFELEIHETRTGDPYTCETAWRFKSGY